MLRSNPMGKADRMPKMIWTGSRGAEEGYEEIVFVGSGNGHFGGNDFFQ